MKKIIFTLLLATSLIVTGQEKEEKGKFTLSGTVDVYGTANFVDGSGTPGILIANPGNANGFGLGFANTVFGYTKGKAGVVADIAFGPRADDANMAGAINQLYAYYEVSDKVTITAGQFNTFLGYEVINPSANFNYTVSYLFNAGPFSHTGVKLDYASSEDLSFMLALTNAHGISSADGNFGGDMQIGGQIGYKGQFLNVIYGSDGSSDDALYLDYTGGFDLSDTFFLGINAAYANSVDTDSGYTGAALYLQNTFSDTFALGLRPEYFQVSAGAADADVFALTLTANASLTDNLKLITDLRYDSSEDGLIEAFAAEKSVSALTIAAVYSF
ncbi:MULTISPECIES: outer membrane beta-barrel protein [Tenacibaculum]|uniref:outer membrane beta-barrel protein n=1 Tax=Tenacibaculum TaxID=104267 RepID=UPI001F0A5416|nr:MULTISPECIES: outer membrane beta-barrel protein [Tenacibaculum]MCH3881433.1 porin [Tenacibaculum aquimarinum]MDO6598973.1 outer membrane beta-barrel protein [Tenacibaculum sp. 1_MG-2023]